MLVFLQFVSVSSNTQVGVSAVRSVSSNTHVVFVVVVVVVFAVRSVSSNTHVVFVVVIVVFAVRSVSSNTHVAYSACLSERR